MSTPSVGDVQSLPFEDASFDTVVAAWMLYHVPDLDRGLAEIARVLARRAARGGDELGAASRGGARHAGVSMVGRLPSTGTTASEILDRHFAAVERIDVDGWVTFPDAEAIRRYVRSMITRGRRTPTACPTTSALFVPGTRVTVFVARRG